MGKTELIRVSKKFKNNLQVKSEITGRTMTELMEYAQFPFIPPNTRLKKQLGDNTKK